MADAPNQAPPLPAADIDALARSIVASATSTAHTPAGSSLSVTTAAQAMHHEEVRRTRQFIALGWLISLVSMGAVPRDMPSLLYMVVHEMPPRPGAIAPVSPQIEAVLAIGMAKSRDARFATTGDLAIAFDQADRGELPDALRQRARASLRHHPWLEPSPTKDDQSNSTR